MRVCPNVGGVAFAIFLHPLVFLAHLPHLAIVLLCELLERFILNLAAGHLIIVVVWEADDDIGISIISSEPFARNGTFILSTVVGIVGIVGIISIVDIVDIVGVGAYGMRKKHVVWYVKFLISFSNRTSASTSPSAATITAIIAAATAAWTIHHIRCRAIVGVNISVNIGVNSW